MKKIHESLEAVYIYIYISQVLTKQGYVNIAKELCILDVSKMHGFFVLFQKWNGNITIKKK